MAEADRQVQRGEPDTAAVEVVFGEVRAGFSEAYEQMRELTLAAVRLSLTGDKTVRRAAGGVAGAVGGLIADHASGKMGPLEVGPLTAAVEALVRARNVAAAPWWRRRRLRRAISP